VLFFNPIPGSRRDLSSVCVGPCVPRTVLDVQLHLFWIRLSVYVARLRVDFWPHRSRVSAAGYPPSYGQLAICSNILTSFTQGDIFNNEVKCAGYTHLSTSLADSPRDLELQKGTKTDPEPLPKSGFSSTAIPRRTRSRWLVKCLRQFISDRQLVGYRIIMILCTLGPFGSGRDASRSTRFRADYLSRARECRLV
jgi:hypothetical protein